MAALQQHMKYVALKIDYWCAVEEHDEQAAASIARKAQELIHATLLPSLPSQIATDSANQPSFSKSDKAKRKDRNNLSNDLE